MVTAVEISREVGNTTELKRKSKVVAFEPLPGVPEGTPGVVTLVNGFDRWIRYRVLFQNGVDMGQINRPSLAPAKEYAGLARRRALALESGAFEPKAASEGPAAVGDDGPAAAAGGATVNGVEIPAHLLERSQSARARLGG